MNEYFQYFKLLELSPGATAKEIRDKYSHLKNLYSSDSIEILALNEDFSQELRESYLSRIDEAYQKLNIFLEQEKPALMTKDIVINDESRLWIEQLDCFDGAALRAVRERLGIDLNDVFAVTKIQPHHLQEIENEVFDFFRAEVYLRSFIIEYARFLSLDSRKVLADYMPRYQIWAASPERQGLSNIPDMMILMKNNK